jgi:hypothetical protein
MTKKKKSTATSTPTPTTTTVTAKPTTAALLESLEVASLTTDDHSASLRAALAAFSTRSVADQQSGADAMLGSARLLAAWHARLQCADAAVLLAWLFASYASSIESLQRLVLSQVPLLVWLHVVRRRAAAAAGEQDACLLSIYNHVVALRNGAPLLFNGTRRTGVETIYHRHTESSPSSATAVAPSANVELTEAALQLLSGEKLLGHVYEDALPPAETITVGNAGRVLATVLRRFVEHFSVLPPVARQSFCNLVARLCLFGLVDAKALPECNPPLLGLSLSSAVDNVSGIKKRSADALASLAKAADVVDDDPDAAKPTTSAVADSDAATAPATDAPAANGAGKRDDDDDDDDRLSDGAFGGDDDDDAAAEQEMARLAAASLLDRQLTLDMALLQCFVEGVHIAVFDKNDDVRGAGRVALDALHKRAVRTLDAKLLLSTSSLLHSIGNS